MLFWLLSFLKILPSVVSLIECMFDADDWRLFSKLWKAHPWNSVIRASSGAILVIEPLMLFDIVFSLPLHEERRLEPPSAWSYGMLAPSSTSSSLNDFESNTSGSWGRFPLSTTMPRKAFGLGKQISASFGIYSLFPNALWSRTAICLCAAKEQWTSRLRMIG